MAPEEQSISLHFLSMDILNYELTSSSCQYAFVEVRDGGTMLSPLLEKACGTRIPDTQHTSDNALFVRYYNNFTAVITGFQAEATIDTCGGTYNADDSGIMTSPEYPAPYSADVNCTWRIVAPVGHFLTITFLDVDIDNAGDNCSEPEGRLVIREKNSTGEILGKVCGTGSEDTVAPIETASNVAYITFRGAHNRRHHTGFRFMFNKSVEECGGELVGPVGEFSSPGYPHGYPHRRYCVWHIRVPEGRRVRLDILDMDLPSQPLGWFTNTYHSCSAFIRIRNGPPTGPVLGRYRICGTYTSVNSYNSSMNVMTVTFLTRGHSTGRGFRARWSSDDPQECGGTLTQSFGQIASPGTHFGGYNHSLYCIWTVPNPNPGNASFAVEVTDLHIERNCFDFIMVEGVTANAEVVSVMKVCQTDDVPVIMVPYPTLRISFITDSSVNRTGWNLTYHLSPCGGLLRGPQNVIQSPNYPSNYPDNTHCAWLLRYDEGSQIDFEFNYFQLENSINHDYVTLQNGPRFSSPLIKRYSGTEETGHVVRSNSSAMLVQFHTDGSVNDRGFLAHASIHTRGCGGIYHANTGNISSHGFPEDYDANSECEWELYVVPGYHTIFTFVERFDLETSPDCQNDYVQFFHSGQKHPDEAIVWEADGKKCGKQMPSPVLSPGIRSKILFHSNEAIQGKGFKVSWEMRCGNNFTSDYGIIVSPGYPGTYPNDVNCNYRIVTSPESFVRLNFITFDLEGSRTCHYDWVRITEVVTRYRWRSPRSWGKYCGGRSRVPDVITARGSVVINFHADYTVTRAGFSLNYTIENCGGNMSEPGIIQLPTRPFYHNSMNCIWDITAPSGKVPHFKFQQLVLESAYRCGYDSISIYDGHNTDDSKLVSRLCGNHTGDLPIVVGRESQTRVVFRTDGSVTREGFRAVLEFTYACGGNINISSAGNTAIIRSLDVDQDGLYEPLLNCVWLVEALDDHVVTFNFTRLDLEPPGVNDTDPCPYDFVEIRDGPSPDSERIGIFCNSTRLPAAISSSSNVMYVRFRSNSVNQRPGFTATVSNTPHPCGESVREATNTSKSLELPGYPNGYALNMRCRWIIRAPDVSQDIHLEINDMNIEASPSCSKDQLYIAEYEATDPGNTALPIYTGPRSNRRYAVPVGRHRAYFTYSNRLAHGYCGTVIPHHLNSETNAVELRFVSDETISAPGFKLHYSIASCNRTFNWTSGTIRNADRRKSCFSKIVAPEGSFINIYFYSFYLRNRDPVCGDNVMKIYDGSEASGEPLLSACGWRVPNPVFSTGNALYIAHTPTRYSYFKLTYTTSTQAGGCGGAMYVDGSSTLTSPGYPGAVAPGLDCVFTIAVAPNMHIALRLPQIDFGGPETCNSTYLEVYDIDSTGQSILFNTVCGSDEVADHLSPSYRMALRYVTGNSTQTGQGWRAKVFSATSHEDNVFDEPEEENEDSTQEP